MHSSYYSPQVTVIVRTQNRPLLLSRAINSLFLQKYTDWEAVIVNDAGNREEVERICLKNAGDRGYQLHFIHNEKSLGRSCAANQGISFSKLPYIAILDDDDTWEPEFLAQTLAFLEKSNPSIYAGVITHVTKIWEVIVGQTIKTKKLAAFRPSKHHVALFELAQGNFIPFHSMVLRRQVIEEVGKIDEHLRYLEDWDFFLRIVQKYEVGVIPLRLANYHFREKSDKSLENQNSVIQAHDQCVYYENYLKNKYLRKDIAEGKLGIGFIMNVGTCMAKMSLWNCIKNDLKRLKKKIFS